MKKLALPFILLLVLCSNVKSQTSISGGNISGTWTLAGSPYNINGDINIANSTTLTIQPGVVVSFQGHYKLNVQGRLFAIGNSSAMISFTAGNSTTGWKGIRFDYTPISNDSSRIEYCKISNGKATVGTFEDQQGGAVFVKNVSKLIIRDCIISNNLANYYGGAISCRFNASPKIINNVFCNNTSNSVGGALYCYYNSEPQLINNTFANNHSGSNGGGLYANNVSPVIKNCIFWGNTATGYSQIYPATLNNISYSCIQGNYSGTGNLSTNPSFVSPSLGSGYTFNGLIANWSLQSSSNCVNSGLLSTYGLDLPEFDIAGKVRFDYDTVDMGAYEYILSTVVCGNISSNTTWSNSIIVACDISVTNGNTLMIMPGTKVKFAGDFSLNVQGKLSAIGTANAYIKFVTTNITRGWQGIRFYNTPSTNDTSKIEYCIIQNGNANGSGAYETYGGGIFAYNVSKLIIRNNFITNNRAASYGGGIACTQNASPKIINNVIVNNTAYRGGGIGIRYSSNPLIYNNTITNNQATNDGGAIYRSSGTPIIKNCIIRGNYAPFYPSIYPTSGLNIQYTDIQVAYSGTGNISTNPQFKKSTSGYGASYIGIRADWSLLATSPCIDAGTPVTTGLDLPPVDLKNKTRVYNSRVDMGAYEDKTTLTACGTISKNTTWDANTVNVTCDVTINNGVTLTVNPGSKVNFQGQYKIIVNGNIVAEGTPVDSIKFTAANPAVGWKGIRIDYPGYLNDSSKFRYCNFHYGKPSGTQYENAGGVLYIKSFSKVAVENCFFSNNVVSGTYGNGGAIYTLASSIIIRNNVFKNNNASTGGAIYALTNNGIIRDNIFSNNVASGRGGAIAIFNSNISVINNIIANNTSSYNSYLGGGGGIYIYGYNTAEFINNSIVNNQAIYGGGVACYYDCPPTFVNNTICNNYASNSGGAFHLYNNCDPKIKNTIVYGNSAGSLGDQFNLYDISCDPKIYYSDIQGGTSAFAGLGSGSNYANVYIENIDKNPNFTSPSAGAGTSFNGLSADWSLQSGSKCINSGTPSLLGLNLPQKDIVGNTRLFNGRIDIGSYENQQDIVVCGTITENTTWDADTIKVNCDIVVKDSVILTIAPGTYVDFQGYYRMIVKGKLLAIGTADEMITLSAKDTVYFNEMDSFRGGWKAIHFVSIPLNNDSSKIIYCKFHYGKAAGSSWIDQRGGALHIYNSSKILISNSIFSNNRAGYAGSAIFIESANPTIQNCMFSNNSCSGYQYPRGGAVFVDDGNPLIINSTFSKNNAKYGGAIYCWAASPIIKNTILYGNEQTGGSYWYGNQMYIIQGSSPELYNCNVQGGLTKIGGYSAINTYIRNIDVDPEFLTSYLGVGAQYDGRNADWKIKPSSPCINTGIPNSPVLFSEDLAGNDRLVADTVDIGAYECPITRKFITSQPTNLSACVGTSAVFSVSINLTVNYQWQKNGLNIPNARNSTYIISVISLSDTGYYSCILSTDFGSITSDTVSLTVNTPPQITLNPVATSSCLGQTATFSISALGTAPISYQWFNTNGMVAGATNSTYTINSVSANNASTFYCVATNNCGFGTSSGASLTIKSAPTVTSITSGTTVCEGSNVSFTTSATGTTPINYQWYNNNGIIVGDTGVQYQISNLNTSHAGYYYCKATNICGSDSTNSAILNVNTSPVITSQSSGSTVCEGQSMTFSITAQGTTPISYLWYYEGSSISGATNNTFTINQVNTSDGGNYYCKATNLCGTAQSTNISLTVNQTPSITTQPNNGTRCVGQSNTFSITATGTAPITYQWYDNNDVIIGATNNTFIIDTVSTSNSGYYYCIVSNSCGPLQSNNAILTVNEAPNITSQTSNAIRCLGQSVTFILSATGTSPITYQWYNDSGAISGATNNTHTISSVDTSDGGTYYCIATNSCGSDQGNNKNLTVNVPPSIISQSSSATRCVNQSMTFSVTASGTSPISYQWYYDTSAIANANNNIYSLNTVAISDGGNYYCIVSNLCGSAQSTSKLLTVNTSPVITSQTSGSNKCEGQSMTFAVTSNGTLPITYQWYKGGIIANASNNIYIINSLNTSHAGDYYCIATNSCGADQSNNINLTVNRPPTITAQSNGAGRCVGQSMTFSITAIGTNPINYQWYKENGLIADASNNINTINFVDTSDQGNYYCQATNSCGTVKSSNINLTVNTPPLTITHSDSSSLCTGQSILLNITSTGTTPLSYQWYYENVAITGAVNNFYIFSSISPSDVGNYHCVAANLCGTDKSKNINLVVNDPIKILSQSGNSSKCEGDSIIFLIDIKGSQPIKYHWYYDTILIPYPNSNQLNLGTLTEAHSGKFHCDITNICGTVKSTIKNLTVHLRPDVYIGSDTTFCKGGNIILTPGNGYLCEWNTGSINPQLMVEESGDYFVYVTDIYGCKDTSDIVNVVVKEPYIYEEICVVTTDPQTGKNLIAWERTSGQGIIGYNIYKESNIGGVYQLIGTHAFDSVSVFVDYYSDPKQRADRYRITAIDTCNNESDPSPIHKTIHLTASTGTSGENNLNWSHYEGFPFEMYRIFRGKSPSTMIQIDSIQNTLNSYSDLNPPSGLVFYQVSALKTDTCYPTIVRGINSTGPYTQSLSNMKDYSNSTGSYLSVDPPSIILDSNAGSTAEIGVFTNTGYWSATTDDKWLELTSNISDGKITVTALTENTISESREGVIIIISDGVSDLFVTVNQLGTWGSIGISESIKKGNLRIYPNPFNHSTHVILPDNERFFTKLEVYDLSGKLVKSIENIQHNHYELFKDNLVEGIYFIKVIADKIYYEKIIIN